MPQVGAFIAGAFGFAGGAALGATAFVAGSAFAATTLGSLAVKLLTTVAISALQQAMAPSPSGGGITVSTTLRGDQNPETITLGRYATAGQCVYVNSHGTSNRYLTHVVELCSAPGVSIRRLLLGDEWVTPDWENPHPDYGAPIHDHNTWVKIHDGHQAAADPMLVAQYADYTDMPWDETAVGTGLCYAILTFWFDREEMNAVPRYLFELDGIPLYDLRQDSSAGGVGVQRLANPATWAQTDNPAVMIWNIMHGIPLPGGQIYGGDYDVSLMPSAIWMAAMNRCDTAMPIAGGGTEPAYRAGLEISLQQEPAAAIVELQKACSGVIADEGWAWNLLVGAPALPTFAFTDDDVIVSKPQEYDPFPSLSDTYNAVAAQFPDPDNLWETKEAPRRTNADWEASDAFGRRTASLQLAAVPWKRQVQRLMRAWIQDERRFRRHILTLPSSAAAVSLIDTLDWSSVRNGYAGKDFSVYEISEDPHSALRKLSIRERDPNDYAWEADFELPMPAGPGKTPIAAETVSGFAVQAITLTDAAGTPRRAAIELGWNSAIDARGLRWQIRLAGETTNAFSGTTMDIDQGSLRISDGVLRNTSYEARARLICRRRTVWADWLPVSTDDVRVAEDDLAEALRDRIADLEAQADAAVIQADEAISQAADLRLRLDTAIRGGLQGWLADPAFAAWEAGNLDAANWSDRSGVASYGTLFSGEFGSGLQVAAPAGSAVVQIVATSTTGLLGADPAAAAVVISLGLEYMSGDPAGARFRAEWSADGVTWTRGAMLGATTPYGTFTEHGIAPSPGVMQFKEVLVAKPAGSFAHLRLFLQPKIGSAPAAQSMKIHAANIRSATEAEQAAGNVAGLTASVTAHGSAISTLQTGAAAGYLIKAQAGGAVSLIDLIAADGGGGVPTSIVKIAATDIILDGSVAMSQLVVTELGGNLIPNGSFAYGDLRGWDQIASTLAIYDQASDTTNPGLTSPTQYGLKIALDATTDRIGRCLAYMSAKGGDRFSLSFQYAVAGSTRDATLSLFINWYDKTGALLGWHYMTEANTSSNTWVTKSGAAQAPAGTAFGRVAVRRAAGGAGTAYVTNIEVVRQRTGATLITPEGITTDLLSTTDFAAAGLAIFGGTVQSDNWNAGAGTGWQITQAGTLTVPNASIGSAQLENLAVTNGKIANLAVGNAKIANLSVDTIKIGDEAVTKFDYSYAAGNLQSNSDPFIMQSTVINKTRTQPLVIHGSLTIVSVPLSTPLGRVQLRDGTNAVLIAELEVDFSDNVGKKIDIFGIDTNTSTGNITYQLRVISLSGAEVTCSKRFIGALNTFK